MNAAGAAKAGRAHRETNRLQTLVRQTPTIIVSIHRVSGVPSAAMMKLAMAETTIPIGRIVTANDRIASDTNNGPRQ